MADAMPAEKSELRAPLTPRRIALILAAVAVVLLVGRFALRPRATTATSGKGGEVHLETLRRASPSERAIVAPLTEGSELDGWRVRMIVSLGEGRVGVVVSRGSDLINVWVMPDGPEAPRAPQRSARYLVYYSAPSRLQTTAMQLTSALAVVLRRNEARLAPAGDAQP